MTRTNINYWYQKLHEETQDPPTMGPPTGDPTTVAGPATPSVTNPAGQGQPPQESQPPAEEEPVDDPQSPDINTDGMDDESSDYETWQREYFDLSIKGDTNELIDSINQIRDRNLTAPQRRFVEDNYQIVLLTGDANFNKASREIRKLITQELDRNNPGVSLMQHIMNTLEAYQVLSSIFIKLAGQGGLKAELHRRMIGALLGAVQTGGGPGSIKPDLIYAARDYSINISTRFQTTWGDVAIGKWTLQEDDPEQFLADPELERLQEGSPEEKRALRRRVCLEAIAAKFANRGFLIHVVDPEDGTLHAFGWDIAEGLRAGYQEGKLVVRKRQSQMRDAMIDDSGAIVPLMSYAINYKRESDEGTSHEVPFMEQRDGLLYLTCEPETLQELAGGMPGMFYQSYPYNGNSSDLIPMMRCYPSTLELLMRRC